MTFSDLISPSTVNDFFRDHFERSYMFCERGRPDHYIHLLTEDDLDQFFACQDLSPKGIRVVRGGEFIPVDQWTKSSENSYGTTVVQIDQLFRHYYEGATIVISGAENKFSSLAKACTSFEQETQILVQANIYITPPGAQGFSMHYDDHDIFTLQIKGPKKWKLYDTGEELPTSKRDFTRPAVLLRELDLNAGDLLYMPRGLTHEAYSTKVSTIHVNFSCKPLYGFKLLDHLGSLAEEEDVFFRKMIPNSFSSQKETGKYIAEFTERLTALIAKNGVESLLEKQRQDFISGQGINYRGIFSNALAMDNLSLDSVIRRRKGISYRLEKENSNTKLLFKKQSISVPSIFDLTLFLQENLFKVRDIKGLVTESGKLTMTREFVKAGFLEIVIPDKHND